MNMKISSTADFEQKWIKKLYLFLLFIMGLSGFAQMPIFKRYYIADIPGLGWLAQYYTTHILHYIGAIALLFVLTYCIVVYLGLIRKEYALTGAAYVRIFLLAAIVVTGIFRVLKNLPDITFSPNFTMFIDISHLGFMMMLMFFGIASMFMKKGWIKERSAS